MSFKKAKQLINEKRFDEAIDVLGSMPHDLKTHFLTCKFKAICYACSGNYKKSINSFVQAGRAKPGYSDYILFKIKHLLKIQGKNLESFDLPGHFPISLLIESTGLKPDLVLPMEGENYTKRIIYKQYFNEYYHQLNNSNKKSNGRNKEKIEFDEKALYTIRKGIAYADQLTSAVFSKGGLLIKQISTGGYNLLLENPIMYKPTYLKGRVAFFSSRWGSSAYYHWLFDVLPRIELLKTQQSFSEIDYFVFHKPQHSYNIESLECFGIPKSKIIDSFSNPVLSADEILVPSIIRGGRGETWVREMLRATFLASKVKNPIDNDRIYITRKKTRRLLKEYEFYSKLEKIGFSIITLEDYSIKQQGAILNNAKIVIAPHGAGLSNLVFCKAGTIVVEFFSPLYINMCYHQLCYLNGMDYYYYIGEEYQDEINTPNILHNIKINVEEAFAYVESIIEKGTVSKSRRLQIT